MQSIRYYEVRQIARYLHLFTMDLMLLPKVLHDAHPRIRGDDFIASLGSAPASGET